MIRWYVQLLKNGLQFQHSIEKWNRFFFTVPLFILMLAKDSFKVDIHFCFWCNNLHWDNSIIHFLKNIYLFWTQTQEYYLASGGQPFRCSKGKIIWKKLTREFSPQKLKFLSLNIYCFVLKHSKARFLSALLR
jgi:hypothetical protein